jgi:predicted DNA-binding transcriptional regulator YafY
MPKLTTAGRFQALFQIHRKIALGEYPNCTTLGEELNVAPKTARKYVHMLERTFGAKPLYHDIEHGYYYASPHAVRAAPRLTEEEVAAYFLLEEASRGLAGSPVQPVLESVLSKLALMLPGNTQVSLDEMSDALSLRTDRAAPLPAGAGILPALYNGLTRRRQVSIAYAGGVGKKPTSRTIDPLHITRCEGQWYVIAYCHLRKDIRTFVPARMNSAKVLKATFTAPRGFNAREHFKSAFGIVAGGNVAPVSLHFAPAAARLVRERVWHQTQQLKEHPDGGVVLTLTCSHSTELLTWLLGWGDQVRVEGPATLRKKLADAHRNAAKAQGK